MRKAVFALLTMVLAPCSFAVDGVVLINQSTAMAAGGFPYRITQSGSYRLSGNLTVPDALTTAILVTADNVTIDLNGFSIIGPVVCTGFPTTSCNPASNLGKAGTGVDAANFINITVVNGTVRGMGVNGIALGRGGYFEKVHATSNGNVGFFIFCPSVIVGNTAFSNGGGDLVTDSGCALANNAMQ
jgi:parallel beta-helix repeat protein